VLTGLVGAFAWAVHYTRDRLGLPLVLLAALFWPSLEWIQAHLGDLAFPWLGLGTALAPFPRLAGAADLVGSRGLTVWIAAVNGLLADGVIRSRSGRPIRRVAAGLVVLLAAPAAYGFWRAATLELRPVARVAVVQPNIPEEVKMDRAIAVDSSAASLTRLTRSLAGDAPDLVVWPEIALPADLVGSPALTRLATRLSREVGAPIVAGAYGVDRDGDDVTAFNSAFLVDGSGIGPRYDKRRLVPFVERVPFIDPALLEGITGELRYFGALGHGRSDRVLEIDDIGYGVLICYESIFAPLSRRYRRQGADFLVNITNDAWYGRAEWYARTTALWQHPAHMVLRAIETRTGVARAANTGISMFIDPLGRPYRQTRLFVPAVRTATVYTTDAVPLFVRWGDWLATLAVAVAVVVLVAGKGGRWGTGDG
nr:apolipoprotein N-acyltransferase [Gemmatimonadota bacterium]NIQ58027.1 apolipoprotein N-acyltransferase [Gemmatimonadota bacterium]NIU78210.1 apolipoprotein N-acyltransferase [Gammaproteobacteria bacterium]NIX47199.1 apolipoprotein N-acyltransferase [Gemmatimonadota bacterium]NIY11575.1 apolipoprotein N-acyltransferase [Gemmatimonadota bacterium]